MVTPDLRWVPSPSFTPHLGINHNRKQRFYCHHSQFTDNVLLYPTPGATGGECWESQGGRAVDSISLNETPPPESRDLQQNHSALPGVSAGSALFTWHALLGCPPRLPAPRAKGSACCHCFLPSPGGLSCELLAAGLVRGASEPSSRSPPIYPCLPASDASMCVLVVLSRLQLINLFKLQGEAQGVSHATSTRHHSRTAHSDARPLLPARCLFGPHQLRVQSSQLQCGEQVEEWEELTE